MMDWGKERLLHNLLWLKITCFCISLNIKKEKNSLLEDIKRLKQDKQALEVDLEKMKKERDQAKDQITYATGEKLYEIKILEETHKQEISRLQKRLQWYAENQELLDKDAVRLKEASEEIEKLRLE
ncbi:PREDICTED: centrosomal protein of 162 kDa-like, partial [Galeopterus variegatus]|uniref:Centrosomal protein of 162 kDa n=1 Tax=Galeopterus variegatus TaxID=482537 RepID=A0ABM0Q397_GALVR